MTTKGERIMMKIKKILHENSVEEFAFAFISVKKNYCCMSGFKFILTVTDDNHDPKPNSQKHTKTS